MSDIENRKHELSDISARVFQEPWFSARAISTAQPALGSRDPSLLGCVSDLPKVPVNLSGGFCLSRVAVGIRFIAGLKF
jgi:hypothetical protein